MDGTSSFIEGLAYWGVNLALHDGDDFIYGISHFPRLRETYTCQKGGALFRNNLPVEPEHSEVDNNSVLYVPSTIHKYAHIHWPGKIRNLGSISSHIALVSSGADAAAEIPRGWKPWDIGAGMVFLNSVGILANTVKGMSFHPKEHRHLSFLIGNKHVIKWFNRKASVQFI